MQETETHCVTIIGAGLSGLTLAYELQRRGIEVVVLESAGRIAEPWRRRHPQLRLNTHRWISHLPGLRIPASAGSFPPRDAIIAHFEAFIEKRRIPLRLNTPVQRIERAGDKWRVATADGTFASRCVVVATGRDRCPHIPDWPGKESYRGRIIHGAQFGDAEAYAGQRVLMVGAGNSGTELLNHLVRVPVKELSVSVRHGPVILPVRLFGIPLQLTSTLVAPLPARFADVVLDLVQWLSFGNLRRHGLPRHSRGAASRLLADGTTPAFDQGFVAALKAGDVSVVPAIESFTADAVRLLDGRRLHPDVVICATGYRPGLEPLVGHLGVLDDAGVPMVKGSEMEAVLPGLWFIGMRPTLTGYFYGVKKLAPRLAGQIQAALHRDKAALARGWNGRWG